jgi:predicted hydrocarbon binding protein
MVAPKQSSAPISGPLVGVLLNGLEKVVGPPYGRLLEGTPWQRFLKHPPSTDPTVVESNDEELGAVFGHIYQMVGRDLFIAFGRYAGVEGGKAFAAMLGPRIAPQLVGLSGVARLQRMVGLAVALAPWAFPLSMSNTADGVELVNPNCGLCSRIKSDEPVCAFLGDGLRNTYTRIGGETVLVKEIACRAQGEGNDCVFKVTLRGV